MPRSVLYDNDRCLVSRILPDGTRRRARLFGGFLSHHLIRDRYGRPGKGNDKGAVEGLVGWARRNFMVPLPRLGDFEALNRWFEERCRARQDAVLRGHQERIVERLERDREAMGAVPGAPFEACEQVAGQVSSQPLVRYRTNDYCVPVAYGHRQVWVRGYVDQVVIGCAGEVIVRHVHSYEREDMVFNPLHYLPLLERKLGALDQAGASGRVGTARGVPDTSPAHGGAREPGGTPRVRAGSSPPGDLRPRRGAWRGGPLPGVGRHRLRRGQAPGAVPGGEAPPEARPRRLSLPAPGHRGQDLAGELLVPDGRRRSMSEAPQILLEHRLKTLKLPTVLREYDKVARQCAQEGLDHVAFLARLVELELIDRDRRLIERRIKAAKFPTIKSLDSFQFKAIPSLNKTQVLELARCEWIERRENVIALGPSGTGKTHLAQGLGLAACQRGLSGRFVTAAALVHELMEARDERRLLRLQKQFANHKLLIIDELGFVPLSKTGAELLFELVSQRYERAAVLITSNLPFDEWTESCGSQRLTGALLDRLTHHVHILEMNGESFHHTHARKKRPSH